jgi:RND family efflux transporter MFP subunit
MSLRLPAPAPLALAAALVLGCSTEADSGAAAGQEGPPPAQVALGQARQGFLEVVYPLLGEVRSTAHARLAAGEPGEVRKVAVREGDQVKRGDLLVEIDPSLAQARMRAAAAQGRQVGAELEQAERDAERLAGAGGRLVAERDIEQARSLEAQLQGRRAELAAAVQESRAVLSRLRVVAPFDGQVAARSVDPGDWVNTGDEVIELVAVHELEILTEAPAELASHVEVGQSAVLRHGGERLEAEVRGVVRALDRSTRTATVRLVPRERAPWLMPGGTVDVLFTLRREADDAIVVPRDALVLGAVGTRVVKAVDGKAQPVPVTVLARSEAEALVRGDGLTSDAQLVVRGNERLRAGQPIRAVSSDDSAEAGPEGGT